MTLLYFTLKLDNEHLDLGRVRVPDGTERSGATIASAMHDVAERIDVWSRFRRITGGAA